MGNNDDNIPESYAYAWNAEAHDVPLKDFLTKYKPSMVQDDGTKPWLWVRKSAPNKEDGDVVAATQEAKELLEEVTKKVESIKNDDSIPLRGSKKKGTKSKKEVREEVQKEATEKLEAISRKHGFVSGKWLLFGSSDKVDMIWNSVATSLIEGPLSKTCAYMAKVATSPREETSFDQHVMHIYIPDVYDKDSVLEVMNILLRNHGLNLSGVKSNLCTAIGLDSKHPSGVPSTVWKNAALMDDKEMKALKDEYFAELNVKKAADTEKAAADKSTAPGTSEAKAKPKLKKKAKDDPFASDDDEEKPASSKKVEEPASKAKKPALKKTKEAFASDSEGEDEEEERRKKKLQAKKAPPKTATGKRSKAHSSDDEEDERPKKTARKSAKK